LGSMSNSSPIENIVWDNEKSKFAICKTTEMVQL
jgi:hypothetical protein